jgi:asparagine synthase (glutamine-hydrolysing)
LAQPRRWYDISFEDRHSGKPADIAEELRERMREAVRSRMVSDVPLGAFLSGGVDSSSVVALMSEIDSQPITTCSIGFDEAALDETSYAQRVAQRYHTDHHSRTVTRDDFGEIEQIACMFDEPFADASALPTWRVCQLAREQVTVALSGDGADEAFAGYRRQVFHHHEERARAVVPAALRKPVFGSLGKIWPKADWAPRPLRAKSTFLALSETGEEGYARGLSVMTAEQRAGLYSEHFARSLSGFRAEDEVISVMRSAPARTGLDRAQYADLTFWLPGDILTKVDRTSMAVSLEAREPLLDHRLIEFAARIKGL